MTEGNQESNNRFGKWLESQFATMFTPKFYREHGRAPSEKDFARWLGISDQNFSQYKLGARRPKIEQAHLLAARLGPKVYDLLDLPRMMPKDPWLNMVVDSSPDLTKEDREEITNIIKRRQEEKDTRGKRSGSGSPSFA